MLVAYLLWLTVFGHRWYLGKISPVYVLTLGYVGIMWFADLFRIPGMVRERNDCAYQRHLAHAASGGVAPAGMVSPVGCDAGGPVETSGGYERGGSADGAGVGEGEGAPGDGAGVGAAPPGNFPSVSSMRGGSYAGGIPPAPVPPPTPWWKRKPVVIAGAAALLFLIIAAVAGGGGTKKDEGGNDQSPASAEPRKLEVNLTVASGQTVSSPVFTLTGVTEPGASVTVKGCADAPVKAQAGEDGSFSATLLLGEGLNSLTVACEKDGAKGEAALSATYKVDPAEYKAQCQDVEFRVLEKNPDALKGQKYHAVGQVAQIMEGSLQTDIRLNVTKDRWGYWDDTIYVVYGGPVPDAYEDSIIEVWGEIQGSHTYTSTAGWKITLPLIKAKFIEVRQP